MAVRRRRREREPRAVGGDERPSPPRLFAVTGALHRGARDRHRADEGIAADSRPRSDAPSARPRQRSASRGARQRRGRPDPRSIDPAGRGAAAAPVGAGCPTAVRPAAPSSRDRVPKGATSIAAGATTRPREGWLRRRRFAIWRALDPRSRGGSSPTRRSTPRDGQAVIADRHAEQGAAHPRGRSELLLAVDRVLAGAEVRAQRPRRPAERAEQQSGWPAAALPPLVAPSTALCTSPAPRAGRRSRRRQPSSRGASEYLTFRIPAARASYQGVKGVRRFHVAMRAHARHAR